MGLQVVAASDVRKLVCGVSASREHFKRAAESGAQIVLVHHGLCCEKNSRRIGVVMRERPRALLDAGRLTRATGIKHFQR
jgi:putative NIF3 family GTP cyclohydrolase 1 type 2